MSKCGDIAKTEDDFRILQFFDDQLERDGFDREMGRKQYQGIVQQVLSWFPDRDTPLTEKDLKKAIKNFIKPKDREQAKTAFDMIVMLSNNPVIAPHFSNEMVRHITSKGLEGVEWTVNAKGERVPVIESIPLSTLRVLKKILMNWTNGGKMFKEKRGFLGTLQYEYMSPAQTLKLDNSGVVAAVNSVTEAYYYGVRNWADQFISPPTSEEGRKRRPYGLFQIRAQVSNLGSVLGLPSAAIHKLYSRVMDGRVKITKEGRIIDRKFKVKKGLGWKWVQPIPFEYIDKDGNKAILDKLDNTPDSFGNPGILSEFGDIIIRSRKMYQSIGKESLLAINELRALEEALKKRAKDGGNLDWLEEHIGGLLDLDQDIAGLNYAEMVSGKYFPTMYEMDMIHVYLENAKNKQKDKLAQRSSEFNRIGSKLSPADRRDLWQKMVEHQVSIAQLDQKLDMIYDPDSSYDPDNGGLPSRSGVWYKNFKHLSNIIDPDMKRTDGDIPFDYINQVATSIKRNDALIKIANSLLDAKEAGANDNQIGAAVDLMDTTFYNPNASSQIMGVDMRPEAWSQHLASVGIHKSPREIANLAKRFSSYTTATLLWGPLQGIVNFGAYALKVDLSGREAYMAAASELTGDRREWWQDQVRKAGINTFSDWVDTYFQKTLRPSERVANKEAIDRLVRIIKKGEDNFGNSAELIKYRKYLKSLKVKGGRSPFSMATLDRVAQWAITRNTSYTDGASQFAKVFATNPGKMYLDVMPSIDKTEQMLRAQSYIMGVKAAVATGYTDREDSIEARQMGIAYTFLTDFGLSHQHVGTALRGPLAGSTVNKMKIWHTQKAGFDWRLARDAVLSVTPDIVDSKGRPDKKVINGFKLGFGGVKVLSNLLLMNPLIKTILWAAGSNMTKSMRKVNPELAAFNSFFFRAGAVTLLMDYVIFAPGTNAFFGGYLKRHYYGSSTMKGIAGMGSGMLSVAFATLNMAAHIVRGDELEDWDVYASRWLRHTPIGVGGVWAFEALMAIGQGAGIIKPGNTFEKNHLKKSITPGLPANKILYPMVEAVSKVAQKKLRERPY